MWIKKSAQELTSERRARRLVAGLCALTVMCLVYGLSFLRAGFNFSSKARIVLALAAGALVLAWRWRSHKRRIRSDVWVCAQCHLVKLNDHQQDCLCGGKFTPMHELRWLEKARRSTNQSPDPSQENAVCAPRGIGIAAQ
jgi:hypothetical protein